MKPGGKRKSTASLFAWVALVAVLSATAYLGGEVLARRWMTPSLALPGTMPSRQPQPTPATPIKPGEPVEGTLDDEALHEWEFRGQAGQTATIEMWFHPGAGSSVEAELMVRLIAPSGKAVAETSGSVFLPPYLLAPALPATGLYRLQILPLSGSPGRYSLGLTLSQELAQSTIGATSSDATVSPQDTITAKAAARFQWPTVQRAISGWTFHDPNNPGHIGLDIAAHKWDRIVAAADGQVVFAEWGGGYGNLVILEHEGGWSSYYAHLTEIVVDGGQEVRQGETLGGAGTTGYSTGSHLHFELRYRGRPVDPHVHLP